MRPVWPGSSTRPGRNRVISTISAPRRAVSGFSRSTATNPYYEVLLPYGALTAVRTNAELGRMYDADRMLDWCFGISDCRGGWGVTVGPLGRA